MQDWSRLWLLATWQQSIKRAQSEHAGQRPPPADGGETVRHHAASKLAAANLRDGQGAGHR
jgi:hypothetical protein